MACEWIIPRQLFMIGCPMNAHDWGISHSYLKLPVVPNFDQMYWFWKQLMHCPFDWQRHDIIYIIHQLYLF